MSASVSSKPSTALATIQPSESRLWVTPLAGPVLPDVKKIAAGGAPGRGCERDRPGIVGAELLERGSVAERTLEPDLQQATGECTGGEVVGALRVRHDRARAADLERVVDLAGCVAVVERRGDESGTEAREVVHEQEDAVRHQRRDAVAGLEPEGDVVARQPVGGGLELAPRHLVGRARHRDRVGLGVETDAERVAQVDGCVEWTVPRAAWALRPELGDGGSSRNQ